MKRGAFFEVVVTEFIDEAATTRRDLSGVTITPRLRMFESGRLLAQQDLDVVPIDLAEGEFALQSLDTTDWRLGRWVCDAEYVENGIRNFSSTIQFDVTEF